MGRPSVVTVVYAEVTVHGWLGTAQRATKHQATLAAWDAATYAEMAWNGQEQW